MKRLSILLPVWLLATAACAQGTTEPAPAEVVEPTDTEHRVQALIEQDGLYVVHFWAPWCHNSRSELESGWHRLVEENEDVTFVFITVFNDGDLGEATLRRYAIPERVHRFAQPDLGPSQVRANRRATFLGYPINWTPTTWIFHRNGRRAFALDYGEASVALMQMLLDSARTDWSNH